MCGAGEKCLHSDESVHEGTWEQVDSYGIYSGRWHDDCWARYGYGDFVFDPLYAGEHLEEEW